MTYYMATYLDATYTADAMERGVEQRTRSLALCLSAFEMQ